jgi:hypothetical protein
MGLKSTLTEDFQGRSKGDPRGKVQQNETRLKAMDQDL